MNMYILTSTGPADTEGPVLEHIVQQTVRGLLLASLHPRTLVSIILQVGLPQFLTPEMPA